MSTRSPTSGISLRIVLLLLAGCATGVPVVSTPGPSHRAPIHYAQSTDSATAGCLRNPACYNTLPGEEAVIPWLSRAVDAAHTATTVAMMLDGAEIKLVEQVLTDCAQKANQRVNNEDEELQGREPDRLRADGFRGTLHAERPCGAHLSERLQHGTVAMG